MQKAIILFFIALTCFSCGFYGSNDTVSIGDDFIKTGNNLSAVDTYMVRMSTVILDSVATSGDTVLWAGAYKDDELGNISSTGYFELGVPGTPDVKDEDRFDSLMLVMHYSPRFYGDTTVLQTLNVYRVTQEIVGDDTNNKLYNLTDIAYDSNPIGSISFKPKPRKKQTLKIRLSDQLGKEFLQMLKNNSDTIKSFEKFREYFKGIAIGAGDNSSAILGFKCDTSLNVVLHTDRIELEKEEIVQSFSLGSTSTPYNRFKADRTGTPIAKIAKREYNIYSSQSSNKTYVESGIGLLTRVDFPTLQQLNELDRKSVLVKAELYLVPEPGTYKKVNLPTQLVLYHSDKYNRIISEITNSDNSVLAAEYNVDKMYNEDTYYKFDITSFINTEISDNYFDTTHGLLIGETSSALGTSLNRVVFADRKSTIYKPVLRLYFMFYKL